MVTTPENRFTQLQGKVRELQNTANAMRRELARQYQDPHYAPRPKRMALERTEARANREADKLYALINQYGTRDWSEGVPCRYLVDNLTWSDLTTTGQLATVPPPAWGYSDADMRAFSSAEVVCVP
jgi:hypothetical protein